MRRCDGRWVTVNGSHIYINGRGFVTLGGGKLKGHRLADGSKKRELVAKYNKQKLGRTARRRILKAHSGVFSKEQESEFRSIISKMPADEAHFYSKFVESKLKRNSYNSKLDSQYSTDTDRVFMNINDTEFEQIAGMPHKGAYRIKFHEEFHQIDNALKKRCFFGLGRNRPRTDTGRDTGKRMSAAIEKDLVNFMSKATGRKIKSTSDITESDKRKIMTTLFDFGVKKLAHVEMLTDALVMHTEGKIDVLKVPDVWAHDTDYAKKHGKNGATAETWATFGAYKYTYTKEMQDTIRELMPETIKVYSEIYKEVVNNGFGG